MNIQDVQIGQKIKLRGMQQPRTVVDYDIYTYTAAFTDLSFGTTDTVSIPIEADATFVCTQLTYMATDTASSVSAGTREIPLVQIAITDTSSGRKLQDQPVDISSLAGTGELPRILEVPRIFQANGTIQVQASNYSTNTDYDTVNLSFQGYKIWFA